LVFVIPESDLCSAARSKASTIFEDSLKQAALACRNIAVDTSLALSNKAMIYSPTYIPFSHEQNEKRKSFIPLQ
jgi:hypothetical protein